jgi:lysozyme
MFQTTGEGTGYGYPAGVTDAIIDLSHFNANPDFALARSGGILAVIHKATEGIAFSDPAYAARRDAAGGLWWGAYHFGDGTDGIEQADFFLSKIGTTRMLALDFEKNPGGPSMTLDQARAFVTRVRAATGRWPGLYGGGYLKQMLGGAKDPVLGNCWLWLAQYGPRAVVPPNWTAWSMWQYTDSSAVPGVGRCDRSRFNGSAAELEELFTR